VDWFDHFIGVSRPAWGPTQPEVWKMLIWLLILGCVALGVVLFVGAFFVDWEHWRIAMRLRIYSLGLWVSAAAIFGTLWLAEKLFDL
jgi:hypothetical protein